MAVVNEVVTEFSFQGDLKPQRDFNSGLDSSVKLLAGFAAGVQVAAAGMFAWASSVFDSLDPMVQLSRETGVALESIQELGYAASVSGSSAQALESSIAGLSRSIGDAARGMGRGKQAFEDLGISVRDANGEVKTADVMLEELRSQFDTLGLSMDEQRSIAASLGIDSSMIQMLNLTGDEMDSLRDRAQRLGVVTEEQGDAVASYNDSLTTLRFGMSGIQNMVAVGFAPMMTDLVDKFVNVLEANQDLIVNGLSWLGDVVTSTAGMIQRMWPILAGIAAGFVVAKIAAVGFGGVLGVVLSPVVLITAAIVAIILIIDDLIVAMQGGQSVIADFFMEFFGVDIVPIIQGILDAFSAMMDAVMALFEPFVDTIMHLFDAIVSVFKGDWEGALDSLGAAFESWIEFISGLFGALWDGVKNMWGTVVDYIKNLAMDLLPDWAIKLLGGAADAGGAVVDGAGRAVDAVSGAASDAWGAVTGWWGSGDEGEPGLPGEAGEPGQPLTMDRDAAVDRSTRNSTQVNNSVEQKVDISISTNDPQRAGAAVEDALQRQLTDAQTMSQRGGM